MFLCQALDLQCTSSSCFLLMCNFMLWVNFTFVSKKEKVSRMTILYCFDFCNRKIPQVLGSLKLFLQWKHTHTQTKSLDKNEQKMPLIAVQYVYESGKLTCRETVIFLGTLVLQVLSSTLCSRYNSWHLKLIVNDQTCWHCSVHSGRPPSCSLIKIQFKHLDSLKIKKDQ